jgi:precorrin-8X/cobalt-precorrin-8 methylmutase
LAGGATIFCDVNMVVAGVEPTAGRAGLRVVCGIADIATSTLAVAEGITRGAAAFRRNYIDDRDSLDGAIVAIGNAPTALFEVLRLVREEGIRPALVVGVPVGFVGAVESKEELAASELDFITLPGNRGGSNIAAAIMNALIKQSIPELESI